MAEITEKDLPGLIERLKAYAKTKGLIQDEVDDFSQEAAFSLYRGRKATFGHLYVDFLRKTYGDTRVPSNVEKSRSTLQYADFDETLLRGNRGDGLPDREATRGIEKIYAALIFPEYVALHTQAGYSQPRRSQLKKSAKSAIEGYMAMQHGYHLMETEDLWISYIEIS